MRLECILLLINLTLFSCAAPHRKYRDEDVFPFQESYNASPHIRHRETVKPMKDSNNNSYFLHDTNPEYCRRRANCQPLNYTTCMGAKLPYHSTTLELTDLTSQDAVQEKLVLYHYLRFVPKCWAVIQPFLCALYMPKCDRNQVDLPSREMCKITLEPCKLLYNSSVFPEFLNCEDERLFPSKCKNDIHDVKFNTTGFCMDPLVETDKSEWWYPDIEGCGLRCKDSFYTENEHTQIHKLIAYGALLCIFLHVFAVTTFVIDWETANRYPALAIFYVNVCFMISYSGWMVQYLGGETREDVVCKKDGTLRKSEPCASENLSCVIVFVMVYYFMVAGMVWFVIFTYAWYMSSLQALGKIQERVDRKRAYFHLVAWSLPLILSITTMAIGEIDGDYVTGICFVGFVNTAARAGLLLLPLAATMVVAGYIIVRGLLLLIKVKVESREIISEHSSRKIRSNIVRMTVFTVFMVIFCVITFGYHHYFFENSDLWKTSLQNFVLCKLASLGSDSSHCKQEERPSVAMLQLQLLALFGAGVSMASWVWCDATLHSWGRYIRRKFHCEIEEPMKVQKHRIIAEAFAKRKKFNEGGRISILCQNHTDPVGLQFELNSAASNELSTTWAANLPRLVNRRGAVDEITCSMSSNNHSIDSEVSLNVRHVSIESRRNSGDSQVSVQIAELKTTRKVNSRRHRTRHKHHFRSNSRNVNLPMKKQSKAGVKRDSSTSLDSHLQLFNALTNNENVKNLAPNLNRRTGCAGLDGQHISSLFANGKLVIPYNRNNLKSGSEDENVSVTISESMFNMKLSNHTTNQLDLNDQLVMKSLRQGLHIEEVDTSSGGEERKDHEQEKRSRSRSSRCSRRSRHSRRRRSSDGDPESRDTSSSCPEIRTLVQSSVNSGASIGCEKRSRGSRQSKRSIDVAVQANAHDIVNQTFAYDDEAKKKKVDEKHKSKKTKTRENKRYKKAGKCCESDKYRCCGTSEERRPLRGDSNKKYSDLSDEENLLKDKCKISVKSMDKT